MTVTTIRPSADRYLNNVSFSGGGTAFLLIDDEPLDDATYVFVANDKDYNHGAARMWLDFPNTVAPSTTQRIKSVQYRARIRMNSNPSLRAGHVGLYLLWPKDRSGTVIEKIGTPNYTSFTTRTGILRPYPPKSATTWQNRRNNYSGKPEWTKAILDLIQAHVSWWFSPILHINLRLSELYLDVDVRDRGTLATPTAAGETSSTRPTVTWDFTANADGDLQKWYQVKVFSSAQYSAAGFNANTTKPVWDSGVRVGRADNIEVGRDLVNGVTYKAYVKVAQDFNGQAWWTNQSWTNAKPTSGAWAETAAFTISLTPPLQPLIAVTPDPTVPWLRNFIKVTSNINLIDANSASVETDVSGWINDANTTPTRTTAQALHGAASLQMSSIASGDMIVKTSTNYPVKAGQTYTAIARFRSAVSARSTRVGIRWFDAAGVAISTPVGSSVSDATANWNAAPFFTGAAPANAVAAKVVLQVLATGGAAEVHYADQIGLFLGSGTTWALGGYSDLASTVVEYSWATVGQRNIAHDQLWSGGDVNRSTDGFYLVSATANALAWDPAQRHHGQGSIRWDVRDATTGVRARLGFDPVAVDPEPSYALAGVPGRAYSFSIRMRASAAFTTKVDLQPIDAAGTTIGSAFSSGNVALTTSWQEVKVEGATLPAGTVWVRVDVHNVNGTVSVAVWLDAALWVLAAAVPPVVPVAGGFGQSADFAAIRGGGEGEALVTQASGDGITYLVDQEVPPGYTVTYRAYTFIPETDTTPALASPVSTYVQTMLDPPGSERWIVSTLSAYWVDRLLVNVTRFEENQHKEQETFQPLRPVAPGLFSQRPVVITDFVGGWDGTLTIGISSDEEWDLLRQILNAPYGWLILPDFGARYVSFGDPSAPRAARLTTTTSPLDGEQCDPADLREVTVPFTEIERP